jgi:hypothetical protein
MAITLYNEHLVVSRATLHPDEQRWIPSVIISWKVGTQHRFHDIKGFPNRFVQKQEAEDFGIEAAKAWVDERMGQRKNTA